MNRFTRILVELALDEDLSSIGDITSTNFVDAGHQSIGQIVSRENAIISGHEVAAYVCSAIDSELEYEIFTPDGTRIQSDEVVSVIRGLTRSVLTAERTVLNFMQRLSGIATVAGTYKDLISHTKAALLDTRKTTRGWRHLEKAAVTHGGANNHRMGLYDAIMVKDNHLVANPSPIDLGKRVSEIKAETPDLKIEVEVDRLDQLETFLKISGIDVVLLDNMTNEQLTSAVTMRDASNSALKLEASGGVNLKTVKGIAETGVDYISVGALTHSVRSIDLGLDLTSL